MGGGGQKQTTQETKEIKLPAWVEAASQANYQRAQEVANRPYDWYKGPTVANLDPMYYDARRLTGTLDDYMQNYGDASTGLKGVMAYNPSNYAPSSMQATTLPGMDRAAYTNPFTNEVEARAIENARRAGIQQQNQLATQAQKAGGFGGSRQAVQQGVAGAETVRGIGDLSASLRQKGFDTATAAMQSDAARMQEAAKQTGEWSQQAKSEYEKNKLQQQQYKISGAAGLADVADRGQAARMNEIATKLGIGNIAQQQQQREYDDKRGKWEDRRNYPLEQLNILLASLGMSPYGHTETGTSTTRSSGGGGGMGQMMGMGGSLLQMMMGLSDESEKTDIKVVGKHPELPVKIYSYRYKDDPKTYPKVVGPMAHEVEKVAPHLVKKIGGKRVVDMRALMI